jgi:anti-sigma factor RsiW
MKEIETRVLARLHAYHDGELGRWSRWRLERRLRRDPRLRRELAQLERLGALVREAAPAAGTPDLWDGIARRLPAAAEPAPGFGGLSWLRPAASAAAAAAAVAAVVWLAWPEGAAPPGGAVRWIDSGGRPMLVLDQGVDADVTIIWMLDGPAERAGRGVGRGTA